MLIGIAIPDAFFVILGSCQDYKLAQMYQCTAPEPCGTCGTRPTQILWRVGPQCIRPTRILGLYFRLSRLLILYFTGGMFANANKSQHKSDRLHVKLLTKDITVLQTEERHCLMQKISASLTDYV